MTGATRSALVRARDNLYARPFEALFALMNVLLGLSVFVSWVSTESLFFLLPPPVVFFWAGAAVVGGTLTLIGSLTENLLLERAGLVLMGAASAVISMNGIFGGFFDDRPIAVLLFTAFSLSCVLRYVGVTKQVNTAFRIETAINRVTGKE